MAQVQFMVILNINLIHPKWLQFLSMVIPMLLSMVSMDPQLLLPPSCLLVFQDKVIKEVIKEVIIVILITLQQEVPAPVLFVRYQPQFWSWLDRIRNQLHLRGGQGAIETMVLDHGNTRSQETESQNPAKAEWKKILTIGTTFINTWNRPDIPKIRLRGQMFLRALKSQTKS